MTINDLQAFVMVYDLRHISNAAVELHLSQSELSKRMRALENELNIKLLDTHNKRRLQITPAGETFYHHAHKMITDYETMMHDLAPNRPTTFAKLIIGAIPISGQYNIAKKIATFDTQHPDTEIKIIEDEGDQIVKRLLSGELQAAIIRDTQTTQLQPTEFQKQPLLADELKIILPRDHPLATQPVIRIQDLARQKIATLPPGSGVYEPINTLFAQQGMTPQFFFESTHIETLLGILNQNNVTFLFKQSVLPFMTEHVVMRSLAIPFISQLNFVYPQRTGNQLLTDLIDYLTVTAQENQQV
ncbi:LysR family transcriptional regulator [Lactiplantibacillus plantarum]|uniref:LysR family transcriptional regulator n=1 Tax=Lactiplantibacillus plantarum TaxID=1590 RepID=UPI0015DCE421|nr:LysR family transcriptional regulator [Lactiplantibacillus plantarum]QLK65067.1 LysR family transcriptional regulator [Lactiplantibacillus plantarum]WKE61651.1 LysR family transcriptional regulator [Lactiplantibacillus plantarum]WOD58851.1 LysR family transcriptional regulator [Lactiplantibacillus plantarum]WQH18708.1 LysR family transcriptional regulator [Lactiplantibacillus plantarum]